MQQEKKQNLKVHVMTCCDPVAVKTYEDLKGLLEEKYSDVHFDFSQELYPLPLWKDVIYHFLS